MNHAVEIRVTRPNLASTQGHYFTGVDFSHALMEAIRKFPTEPLTAQLWKTNLCMVKGHPVLGIPQGFFLC